MVSEYLGSGLAAQLHAATDREEREKLQATQRIWRKQISEYKDIEADLEFLVAVINGLVRATYLTSGYHPYKGQWRKKRHAK